MLTGLRALVVAAGLVASPGPVEPIATSDQVPRSAVVDSLWPAVERLVFAVPLTLFVDIARSSSRDPRLDWSTDGCSAPIVRSTGRSFDFTHSCWRHDFAYRNIRRIDEGILWTPPMRHRVDAVFLRDMRHQCARRRLSDRPTCTLWAIVFHRSVRFYAGP